ncbi:hypothetical protein EYF80_017799 [Liparis tanakae]|uniref:Uncharacterized protein n=1 Tax=Liparis tanakae TaxID=230148 RepID=A0A4Z2I2L0_9TELE|nr:hypothetical protein EYF80_017799 [Liparis tanakae]
MRNPPFVLRRVKLTAQITVTQQDRDMPSPLERCGRDCSSSERGGRTLLERASLSGIRDGR